MPVLLLTHSADHFSIDRVAGALAARGVEALRIDTDLYPLAHALTVRFRGDGPGDASAEPEVVLIANGRVLDLAAAPAIWSRRLWPAERMPRLDPRFAGPAARMARTCFFDALALCQRPFWVNPPEAGFRAESKLLQLAEARRVGLRVPDTLATNDPDAVRALAAERGAGGLITKLLLPLSQTMDGSGAFVYTSRLDAADLDALADLRPAPQLFQPLLPAKEELRVIAVGERLFAGAGIVEGREPAAKGGAVAPRAGAGGPSTVDWRVPRPGERLRWERRELDQGLAGRLLALLGRLGLVYGALDLIDAGDGGEPWFLEVNPAGEWGWLERDLGLPISAAIADLLVDGARRRGHLA
jgi:glutathione synthase/RimK-type ligase-like ATP-grasp enzyme